MKNIRIYCLYSKGVSKLLLHTFFTEDKWDCKWRIYCWASRDISPRPWILMSSDRSSAIFSNSVSFPRLWFVSSLSSTNPWRLFFEFPCACFSESSSCISRFLSRQSLYSAFRSVYLQFKEKYNSWISNNNNNNNNQKAAEQIVMWCIKCSKTTTIHARIDHNKN